MEVDITRLTFLADPMTYQGQPDELCLYVPAKISSAEELLHFLQVRLKFSVSSEDIWYALHDPLVDWALWKLDSLPSRVVLIHTDIPLLTSEKRSWIDLEGYLTALIESIAVLQRNSAHEPDPSKQRELVTIFPEYMREEIQAVFTRPPDWQLTTGFADANALDIVDVDPSESLICTYLSSLNGITAHVCTLFREDLGIITAQYLKHMNAYCVRYQSADRNISKVASTEPNLSILPLVSLTQASLLLVTFFHSGQLTETLAWPVLSDEAFVTLEKNLDRLYYLSDEEALVELSLNATRFAISNGIIEAVGCREEAFSVDYWRGVLSQPESTLTLRLAAICVIGRSDLPEAPILLHPFLHSPIKQERWVSARFLGMWQEEDALPVLLSMLTDELPVTTRKDDTEYDGFWYDSWRSYAPKLLRTWESSEVKHSLREALAVWIQTEPHFDQYIDGWIDYEKTLCYELGYREDLTALSDLELEEEHKDELLAAVKQGYKVKRDQMTPHEEYEYLQQNHL